MSLETGLIIVILILLVAWFVFGSQPMLIITRPIGWVQQHAEHMDPGFNEKYDRTFHQSMLDHQMDKTKDKSKYGMTVDDYLLSDLLQQQHGVVKK
jgi:L-arabinose isomerase